MASNIHPKDMRTWIAELEEAGELIRIAKPVDPLTQMGSLLYQSREKALFFEKLPHGWRSLGQAPANTRHAAIAFGTTQEKMVPLIAERMGKCIKPVMVEDGPVKEVKLKKNEFDLTQLPVHIAGQRDGGPVIGSGLVVTKDPDTGQRNVSFHRLQIKGPNKSGILLYPRHTWKNYVKYQARNEPMPVAIFIGHYPLYYAAAATTAAYGLDEFEIAGGYLGEPVRLVKCETVDLEVPADAEIVLEGHIPPHYREEEGPFSEFQDYYVTGTGKNPIVEYQYMTRRHDAIFKNLQNGSEMEGCVFHKVPMSAAIFRRLKDVGGGPNSAQCDGDARHFRAGHPNDAARLWRSQEPAAGGAVFRIPASESRHGGRCRCRHLQSVRTAVGAEHARRSAKRRDDYLRHAQSRHGRKPGGTRRARDAALATFRLENADRCDDPAASRCRSPLYVRAHSAAQSATAARRFCRRGLSPAGSRAFPDVLWIKTLG